LVNSDSSKTTPGDVLHANVSAPETSDIRRRLGVGPGSVLEWDEEEGRIFVRRAGRFTSEEIHQALFGAKKPKPRTLDELKEGIRRHMRMRYARG
jgi:bifunctional DNA-binding transcriptional regulator/antitoxin component of YhaV-PrlF toxin-antitoxin module